MGAGGPRIDRRSLAERRPERADRVEQDKGASQDTAPRVKERIAGIYRELQALRDMETTFTRSVD